MYSQVPVDATEIGYTNSFNGMKITALFKSDHEKKKKKKSACPTQV